MKDEEIWISKILDLVKNVENNKSCSREGLNGDVKEVIKT